MAIFSSVSPVNAISASMVCLAITINGCRKDPSASIPTTRMILLPERRTGKETSHKCILLVGDVSFLRDPPHLDDQSRQHMKQTEQEICPRSLHVDENQRERHSGNKLVDFFE
jgi:hypothetical protein